MPPSATTLCSAALHRIESTMDIPLPLRLLQRIQSIQFWRGNDARAIAREYKDECLTCISDEKLQSAQIIVAPIEQFRRARVGGNHAPIQRSDGPPYKYVVLPAELVGMAAMQKAA